MIYVLPTSGNIDPNAWIFLLILFISVLLIVAYMNWPVAFKRFFRNMGKLIGFAIAIYYVLYYLLKLFI